MADIQRHTTPANGNARCVLVVEDEPFVRVVTAEMLSDLGYLVAEAASASDALDIIAGGLEPDILVTDYLMPGMNGTDLARRVLADRPLVHVLIVSAYAEKGGLDPGIAFLAKPFREQELASMLANFTDIAA
jgi:CheY-like chemotaxis protein